LQINPSSSIKRLTLKRPIVDRQDRDTSNTAQISSTDSLAPI